jgi:N-acetylglucosamine-6-phosphate deacetylase
MEVDKLNSKDPEVKYGFPKEPIKTERKYLAIVNGTIISHGTETKNGIVVVSDKKIIDVGQHGLTEIPAGAEMIDADGNYITPGMIDIHVNGAMGEDVTKVNPGTFDIMGKFFASHGVTSYLATAITSTEGVFIDVLENVRGLMQKGFSGGAELLGVHMEGPFLNINQRGAHPLNLLSMPNPGTYLPYMEYSDVLKKMTLAPELPGAPSLVRELRKKGIVAAAGHTDGIYSEMIEAINEGITHATHFFCNMSHFRRSNLKRVAGAVETLLYDDRISGELIADGWHIDPILMKLLVKVKGIDKVCLVTDAMSAAGMPDGQYSIGGVEAVVENGIARLPDNSAYAGSVTTMDICLRNAVSLMDLSIKDAMRTVTLTPAVIIGISGRKGSIEKGKDADILVMDHGLNVLRTIAGGKVVFTLK